MSKVTPRMLATLLLVATCLAMPARSLAQSLEVPPEPIKGFRAPAKMTEADATLVVFNEADPESRALAQFYAQKRSVPVDQVIGLRCSASEEINRAEYEKTIAEPLRRAMTANFWWKLREPGSPLGPVEWNKIRYVVLMRGVPLKIRFAIDPGDKASGAPPVSQHNEASVDSELAVLPLNASSWGAINNPYFRSYSRIGDAQRPELMLVCRLDAPTPEIVRRMITDSIAAERDGLRGFAYIDARGLGEDSAGLKEGDDWLMSTATAARKRGLPVILDNGPGLFPDGYPMRHAALYFGWYTEQVSGTFKQRGFRFRPGAIAVHIHSFSAVTVRESGKQWVAPLLESGAAATLGNVYEPYLALTPRLDVFYERLAAGFTFAESAYMAQRALSWMTTFIGDPLYRPFPVIDLERKPAGGGEWEAYEAGAEAWFGQGPAAGTQLLQASGRRLKSGIIFESLGLLQLGVNAQTEALASFQEARRLFGKSDDAMRAAIHEVILLRGMGREPDALALAKRQIAASPQSPAVSVFQMIFPALAPASSVPASPRPRIF
jgi:uncharacterized protein (TIGR03790 family)